jgi:hypothetical protein
MLSGMTFALRSVLKAPRSDASSNRPMPDPILILEAMAAAALTAAAVLLLCARPWRTARPEQTSAGSALGVGLGFLAGCWSLRLRPHWPPLEDRDRLLLILLPTIVGVEVVAAFAGRSRGLVWLLRLMVAAGTAPVLLHNTSYLTDLAGPGTREWAPAQTWMNLTGMAAALAGVWTALTLLVRRTGRHANLLAAEAEAMTERSVPLAVALVLAGAAVTVMLSGYASGGEMGLPLAAALAGVVGASLALRRPFYGEGALSVAVVGLFALLVMGRFFGQLATGYAALLFFGLLLCWLPELPYVRRLGPRLRGLARVALMAVPVAVALTLAQQKFVEESSRTSPGAQEPSIQDYMNFGK